MGEIGLEEMLKLLSKEKGGTSKQYNQLMDYISFHETGPAQRMSGSAKQKGGGPGRGLFQFEVGDGMGGNTAVNRTHAYLTRNKKDIPVWLDKMWNNKKSADVSSLSDEQQKMLFLGYHREHPKSNFSDVWSGKQSTKDFWLNNHWAGSGSSDKETIQAKSDLFNKSMIAKDSVDAINLRKQELFSIQDKVPFQSASNDINNVPDINSILSKIFGAQTSSLVQEPLGNKKYDHGGVHNLTDTDDEKTPRRIRYDNQKKASSILGDLLNTQEGVDISPYKARGMIMDFNVGSSPFDDGVVDKLMLLPEKDRVEFQNTVTNVAKTFDGSNILQGIAKIEMLDLSVFKPFLDKSNISKDDISKVIARQIKNLPDKNNDGTADILESWHGGKEAYVNNLIKRKLNQLE